MSARVRSDRVRSFDYFSADFLLYHPAASRVKKHSYDGADFILAFLASNYADIQTCRPRLKFRYENNFAIATSIARSNRFDRSQLTFPLVLALCQMNIVLLLQILVVIATVVLIVTAVSLPIV